MFNDFLDPIGSRNAIIIPGPMVAEARGKLGGLIFSRNGGGTYAKTMAVPTNPATILQGNVRADFAQLASDWTETLTPIQRDAWIDYAAATPWTNSLGQVINLTGTNWFVKLNAVRLQAALAIVVAPPAVGTSEPQDNSFNISDVTPSDPGPGQIEVTFDDTRPWTTEDGAMMMVYQGQPQSLGVENFGIRYRFSFAILGAVVPPTSPVTLGTEWFIPAGGVKHTAQARIMRADMRESARVQSPYLLG